MIANKLGKCKLCMKTHKDPCPFDLDNYIPLSTLAVNYVTLTALFNTSIPANLASLSQPNGTTITLSQQQEQESRFKLRLNPTI